MASMTFLDDCIFVPASGGTGNFVVSVAVQGYMTPAQAGVADGQLLRYRAQSSDLSQWELGWGAYTAGTTTLARTNILFSSNSNLVVSFTSAPNVGIVQAAEDINTIDGGTF